MSEKISIRGRVQSFGGFLTNMVLPNIGAFIAWGLVTALFIESGWFPNKKLAGLVAPSVKYLLPLLLANTGGTMVGGKRGGVLGSIATMGLIIGAEIPMFLGAMIMGPLGGYIMKKVDSLLGNKIRSGFEMVVNNFAIGILGFILMILSYLFIGPLIESLNILITKAIEVLVSTGFLPLLSVINEPAKVLFLNNVIDQGIYYPLGMQETLATGKSIYFMVASNPGPGLGLLLAYTLFGNESARKSAPGAIVIHFIGGIHELYFPYVLMKPITIIAMILGGMSGTFIFNILGVGLTAGPSPGSIISYLALTPRGNYFGVILGVFVATLVSFLVTSLILKASKESEENIGKYEAQTKEMKQNKKITGKISKVAFACDAGMGSSAMGASRFAKMLKDNNINSIQVKNFTIEEVPSDYDVVVLHKNLYDRAKRKLGNYNIITIENYLNDVNLDRLLSEIKNQEGKYYESFEEKKMKNKTYRQILKKENIILDETFVSKEEVIKKVQELMEKSGYVDKEYEAGMLQREKEAPTHFGIGLAIPHGTSETKKSIKKSGIVVIVSKKGVDWDGELVKLIVGIAGKDDDHIGILANVANKINAEEVVNNLVENANRDEIYEILTKENK
ncbi:PTS mannitol transporter subunit IICBA [Anaerococcus sp. WCA-380-WT-2B]|uniref:Mannitol-specific phosphotransferase enzyme IIA component n=1 Tax=Anaerococcus porci TaxID=2652269 RepID=A0A6N7VRE7_9FIRM|nr:PTS mannitol transporter subunit IICBA [Anaerococcus porci]MSS77436.1 PTS mannitol transporter subunit IICBA [Anaerococcus porci]